MEANKSNKYGPRLIPRNPWLPEAKSEEETSSNEILQRVLTRNEYPPIFSKRSWTKACLAKDTQMYFKPTETIGANFTPGAQEYRIQDLPRKKKKPITHLFGEDGKLNYPTKRYKKPPDDQEPESSKTEDTGFVDIYDLLSGDYHRRKKEEKIKKVKELKMKKKMEALKWEGFSDEKEKGHIMDLKRTNCYALYFSDFSKKTENNSLSFSEKSVKAAETWQALEETEKNKYRALCENHSASIETSVVAASIGTSLVANKSQHLCSICGRNFKAAFRLRFHSKPCGSVDSQCPMCQKHFKTVEGLQKHKRFVHNKERLHTCPNCSKQFICRADLRAHFNIHESVRFKCDLCESTFSNISNKKKHNKKYH